ncbi:hypothetical protein IPA_06190 [Ignicoccus pacificus DSM 13166]|uniref:CRISPR system ring nuclease SSO1393-like domain-containing protein n=1 Tax=Ignicoccus pacificus DSM 13166 TaxID=940294 RepID=A0A977KBG6_9CREN|nr:hypothetical protein IPA_06190 [Ignicoccus pacificus DSM 13166]
MREKVSDILNERRVEGLCEVVERLASLVSEDLEAWSAELNALNKFYSNFKNVDEVTLLCTDTLAGQVAYATVFKALGRGVKTPLGELKPSVKAYVVKELGKNSPHSFYVGLLSLTCCLNKEIAGKNKYYLNLTGGFKPESAYATAIALTKVPSVEAIYYVHETFRDLVLLPLIPLSTGGLPLMNLLKEPYKDYFTNILGSEEEVKGFVDKLEKCLKGSFVECKKPLEIMC